LTIASIVGLLPQALIGMVAGVWIDRYPRKRIIMLADSVTALASLALGICFYLGIDSLTLVYGVLFVRALGETFHKPSMQAAMPQLVPADELTRVGGLMQLVNSASGMVGPMLGALLMSQFSISTVLLVDVAGALIALSTVATARFGESQSAPRTGASLWDDWRQGYDAFRHNRPLARLAIPMLISTITFVPIGSLLPLLIKTHFNGTAWQSGLVQTAFSTGMLVGALVIGITGGLKRQFLMIALANMLLGVSAFVAGSLPSSAFWLFCGCVVVMGMSGMGFNIPFTAYIQRSIDPAHLGKVIAFMTSMMSMAAPIGMLIAGPTVELIGVTNWMMVAGITMMVIGGVNYLLTRSFDHTAPVRNA
jgi:DHA3 family macrolide efflux protein-like MFS transporter